MATVGIIGVLAASIGWVLVLTCGLTAMLEDIEKMPRHLWHPMAKAASTSELVHRMFRNLDKHPTQKKLFWSGVAMMGVGIFAVWLLRRHG